MEVLSGGSLGDALVVPRPKGPAAGTRAGRDPAANPAGCGRNYTTRRRRRNLGGLGPSPPPSEWSAGHVDGSTHRYLADIRQSDLDLEKDREVWVACGTGYRATIAAGFIEQAGYTPVVLAEAGVPDVLTARAKSRSQPSPQLGL
jgi:hypothetical protein